KEQALANAIKRFDQDLLPIVADKIESSNNRGSSFIFGNEITAADIALYAFLKQLLALEESHLVSRRPVLMKYINAIEDIPLNKVQGSVKKGYTRQKLVLIGENKESI
ncbi:MAG: glutathione S-transferase family protein, partial [Candidatus Caenarcaniphilales bacterium]|nr:glutathione S-transferase family protein [Candidatus Caenarcaniphilales bacterium]